MRRKQKREDESFMASQASDDTAITAAIVKQMQTNMDKKRKDKESKLVKTLHRDMDEAHDTTREQFTKIVHEFQAEYDDFKLKLAVCDDEIRKTWVQIAALFEKAQASDTAEANRQGEAEAARADAHEHAMSLIKGACDMQERQFRILKTKANTGHLGH